MRYDELDSYIPWLIPSEHFAELSKHFPVPIPAVPSGWIKLWMPGKYWEQTKEPAEDIWRPRKGGGGRIRNVGEPPGFRTARRARYPRHRQVTDSSSAR